MNELKSFMNENAKKMELYTKAITKVHGKSHPEVFEVRELYQDIMEGVNGDSVDEARVNDGFAKLVQVTDNYTVPSDGCETFAAVYENLNEANQLVI